MSIAFIFWLLLLLWLVFGLYVRRGEFNAGNYGLFGGDLLLFTLFFLLGWRAFGWPVQG